LLKSLEAVSAISITDIDDDFTFTLSPKFVRTLWTKKHILETDFLWLVSFFGLCFGYGDFKSILSLDYLKCCCYVKAKRSTLGENREELNGNYIKDEKTDTKKRLFHKWYFV
jgi:hypothetical protein